MKRYYPWLMVAVAALCLMFSNGMSITGLPVFDESLLGEFGWDRGQLKFRDMVTFMVAAIAAPFFGVLIDRFGVRICMLVGWVVLAVAYFFYGQIQSLTGLYSVHAMLGFVLVLCGLNVAVILVSHWFTARRGTALGLTLVGTSLGGVVMPQYGTYAIEQFGWRSALQAEVAIPVAMFLLVFFIVKNRPEDIGQEPLGGRLSSKNGQVAGVEFTDALKSRSFWALALIAMTTFYTVLGVQAHLFLYMRDLEFTPQVATNAISLFFTCALIGKFVFGFLADYLNRKLVFYSNLLVMVIGGFCLALMKVELLWVAVITFGLGWGGTYTMIQLSAINCFGLKSAGKILGTITVLDALGGGLGIWLTGVLYEQTGSYALAYQVFVGLIVFAIVCVSQVKEIQQDEAEEVGDVQRTAS